MQRSGQADPDILVVGAGLSGLAVGRALKRRGAPFLVLEAAARAGGVIRSGHVAGRLLEWGPQRARLTPAFRELCRELAIDDALLVAPPLPLFIYHGGDLRAVPLSLGELLRSNIFSARGKLRLLLEPLTPPARADESAGHLFRRRFGRQAYDHLLGPLFGGLYASNPDDMLARHALMPLLAQLGVGRSMLLAALRRGGASSAAPACSFPDGLQTLTDAMHRSIAEHTRFEETVLAVTKAPHGYTVETTAATRRCRCLVLTTDAPTAARLLASVSSDAAARVAALRYNRFDIVHLAAATSLRGMGYQVSFAESMRTRGVTFNAAMFGRGDVHTAFVGGGKGAAAGEAAAVVADIARSEFRTVTGADAEVLQVSRAAIPAWDRSWTALDGLSLPPDLLLCTNWESRVGIPGRLARGETVARMAAGSG